MLVGINGEGKKSGMPLTAAAVPPHLTRGHSHSAATREKIEKTAERRVRDFIFEKVQKQWKFPRAGCFGQLGLEGGRLL